MNIRTHLSYSSVPEEHLVHSDAVVVIDVLRAVSTMCQAFFHGAQRIIPVAEVSDALEYAAGLQSGSYILGGERHCEKPDGFHCGNSPYDYSRASVNRKSIIFTSSNGTRALLRARTVPLRLLAGFVNVQAVAAYIDARFAEVDKSATVDIVCAGTDGRFSYEDSLCAGALAGALNERRANTVDDTTHAAMTLFSLHRDRLTEFVKTTEHARRLMARGYEQDIHCALALDSLPVVPVYNGAEILAAKNGE